MLLTYYLGIDKKPEKIIEDQWGELLDWTQKPCIMKEDLHPTLSLILCDPPSVVGNA